MKIPATAREVLDGIAYDYPAEGLLPAHAQILAYRVEKVLTAHAAGGGWACELCQTHLPCPTVSILNGESE
jgi:hypothetical protein